MPCTFANFKGVEKKKKSETTRKRDGRKDRKKERKMEKSLKLPAGKLQLVRTMKVSIGETLKNATAARSRLP